MSLTTARRARSLVMALVLLAGCDDGGGETPDGAVDAARPALDDAAAGTDASTPRDGGPPLPPLACPTERQEADRTDDGNKPQIRVMYVLPSDGADEGLDTDGTLCTSVRAWRGWLARESGGATLRLDTAEGELDIGFARLSVSDAQMRGSTTGPWVDTGIAYVRERIERELRRDGHLRDGKLYAVYYGGTSDYACGGGAYPPTIVGQVAAMYLEGQPPGADPCRSLAWATDPDVPGYIDYAMLHELVHSLGFVEAGAPNEHAAGHVFDPSDPEPERDLMYTPRTGDDPGWGVFDGLRLDPTRGVYWGHGDRARLDLARSAFLTPTPDAPELPPGW